VNRPLPDNFLRPYIGYQSIQMLQQTATSNYNSLQMQLNRRFTHGLQFAASYVWSKAMGYAGSSYATYYNGRLDYGRLNFDVTHNLTVNYSYDLPKASRIWNRAAVRLLFDGWENSSTVSLQSGRPTGINYTRTSPIDVTGGGDYDRVFVIQPAALGHGDRSFSKWFNTSAFAPPVLGEFPGNAPVDVFRGPGRNNWDMAFNKNFRLFSDRRTFQLRWEMYNLFNHPSFNAVDNTARFDPAGNQVNTRFGQEIGTLTPRVIQISARIRF
jgi:hypothetical protein